MRAHFRIRWLLATLVCVGVGFGLARWRSEVGREPLAQAIPLSAVAVAGPGAGTSRWKNPLLAGLEQSLAETIRREAELSTHAFSGPEFLALCAGARGGSGIPEGERVYGYAKAWAKRNPQAMFEFFIERGSFCMRLRNERPGSRSVAEFEACLFPEWMKQDEAACLRAFDQLPKSAERARAVHQILTVLWKSDPHKAVQVLAGANVHGDLWTDTFALNGTTLEDASERFALLAALPAGSARARLQADFMYEAAVAKPAIASALWQQCDAATKTELATAGYEAPPQGEPFIEALGLARTAVEATPTPRAVERFLHTYAAGWVQTDLPGAVEWVSAHAKGRARSDALADVFEAGFATVPEAAAKQLPMLLPDSLRERVIERLGDHLGNGGSPKSQAFYGALTPAEAARVHAKFFLDPSAQ